MNPSSYVGTDDGEVLIFKHGKAKELINTIDMKARVRGTPQQLVAPPARQAPDVINLLDALRQSVARAQETVASKAAPSSKAPRTRRRASRSKTKEAVA